METVQIGLWVVVMLVVLALAVRLHERLPRRRQLDRHRRVHRRAQAAAGGGLCRLLQRGGDPVFQLKVAATIGKGIVEPAIVDHYVVFGALIGAITWNIITWYYGIPRARRMR
jgi:PiT family inorganic phosphate transporter